MKPLTFKKKNTGRFKFAGITVLYSKDRPGGKRIARAKLDAFFRRVYAGG